MEFLKEIFGEKAMTYAELEAALKDSKTVKLGNLAGGAYVGKDKFDAEKTRADGLQTSLADANKQTEALLKLKAHDESTAHQAFLSENELMQSLSAFLMSPAI